MGFLSKAVGAITGAATGSSIAGTLIAGGLDYLGQSSANAANAAASSEQMAFQERMSSTAYQRAVADLKAADLNPMLAYGNPASSPAGSMARAESTTQSAVSHALQAKEMQSRIDLNKASAIAAAANARQSISNANQVDQNVLAAKQLAEWNTRHPWLAGAGMTIKNLSPFVDATATGVHSAAAAKNAYKPATRQHVNWKGN